MEKVKQILKTMAIICIVYYVVTGIIAFVPAACGYYKKVCNRIAEFMLRMFRRFSSSKNLDEVPKSSDYDAEF